MATKADVELIITARNEASKTLDEIVKSFDEVKKGAGKSGILGVFSELKSAFSENEQGIESLRLKQAELKKAINDLVSAQKKLLSSEDKQIKAITSQEKKIADYEEKVADLRDEYDKLKSAISQGNAPSEKLVRTLEQQKKKQSDLSKAIKETVAQLEKLKKQPVNVSGDSEASIKARNDEINRLTSTLSKLKQEYQSVSEQVKKSQADIQKSSLASPSDIKRLKTLENRISRTVSEIERQKKKLAEMQSAFSKASLSSANLTSEQKKLTAAEAKLRSELDKVNQAIKSYGSGLSNVAGASSRASKQFRLLGDESRQALSVLQRIRGQILSIASAYVGIYALGDSFRALYASAVVVDKATARLTARLGDDMRTINDEFRFVREQADRLGISFEVLLDQYTRFLGAVPEGTLSLDQIKFSFVSVAEAARVAGLSVADMQGVFVALSQLAGKGINLEDLRQQLQERIPGATEALRIGMSELEERFVSLEEVLDRINKSELSGSAIVALGLGLRRMFEGGLDKSINSAQAALGRFQTQLFDIKRLVVEEGFIQELVGGLEKVTFEMKKPAFRDGMKQLAQGLVGVIKFLVKVVQNFDALTDFLKAIIVLKVGSLFTSWGRQLLELSKGIALATSNAGKLGKVIGVLRKSILLLPGAFLSGFAVGKIINKEFPAVRKFAVTVIGVFEKLSIDISTFFATAFDKIKAGLTLLLREIIRLVSTLLPKVFTTVIGGLSEKFASIFSDDLARKISDFVNTIESNVDSSVNNLLDSYLPTDKGADERIKRLEGDAERQKAAVDRIIAGMIADIDAESKEGFGKAGSEAGNTFGKEFEDSLKGLDYTRPGTKAGKSFGESLLTEYRRILEQLEDESADTLAARLEVIRSEFDDFLKKLDEFDASNAKQLQKIRQEEEKRIAEIKARSGLSEEEVQKKISKVRLETESRVKKIREEASKLEGARDSVNKLVKIRQEAEIKKDADKAAKEAQQEINNILSDRQSKLDRLASQEEAGLITTQERVRLMKEINDEALNKLSQALEVARDLAKETGNASLEKFLAGFDGVEQLERRKAVLDQMRVIEQAITSEIETRDAKLEIIEQKRQSGQVSYAEAVSLTNEQLSESNELLAQMYDKAIALAQSLGDEGMVAKLEAAKGALNGLKKELFSGDALAEDFSSGFVNAFNSFVDGTKSASDAFRQFAADFLRQIANMILQAVIFRAVSGFFGGAAGGLNAVTAGVQHSGGIVGASSNRTRLVNPLLFTNAVRMHSGGIAGLKQDEVPTILQRGEEVITRDDPRHQSNANGTSGGGMSVKIVNTIDAGTFVSEGVDTPSGEKAILNFIRSRKNQIKAVLT